MKKITISGFVIITFVLYAIFYHKSQNAQPTIPVAIGRTEGSQSGKAQSSPTVPSVNPTTVVTSPVQGYKDGSYTGKVADAFYGNIQVKAIISGGKITDVQFLQYPNDQRESIEINTQAMPLLTQEAIQTQSASVDIVSRATDSSKAFNESLASALDQAH